MLNPKKAMRLYLLYVNCSNTEKKVISTILLIKNFNSNEISTQKTKNSRDQALKFSKIILIVKNGK